ncbi:MAG: hypothetical protein INR73_27355 [Williamsia sp.]|nr:hypothetical protein [Williamsia sp.]
MNNISEKKAGTSLIVFVILLVFTMVLHPAGGSIEYLIRITRVIIIAHAIAALSLPFGWIGFWGLTRKIGTGHFGSVFAFATISFGLVAVMLAAVTNGLVLPIFLHHYKDAVPETLSAIKPIVRYNSAVNHAFDYMYTGAFCLAMLCWSIAILLTKKMTVWIGWLGIALAIGAIAVFSSDTAVNSLQGFRIFVTGMAVWILLVGTALCRQK